MKKLISLLLTAVFLCGGIAAAQDGEILGKPFPDFTVTDVDGNTFTLSEKLKDHEAVLINLWATWCPPCRLEFPFLNEAWEQYGDRVAFISLSVEEGDTPEKIREFRSAFGLSLPVGRDEDGALYEYINGSGPIPATVVVDRFGNAVFFHNICFASLRQISSVLESFLGGGYTETAALTDIPVPDGTAVFPAGASRKIHVENPGARQVFFRNGNPEYRLEAYVVNDSAAHLRLEIPVSDDPYAMVLYHANRNDLYELPTLLTQDRLSYALDVPMPGAEDGTHLVDVCLYEFLAPDSPDVLDVYLIPGEEYLKELCEALLPYGWTLSDGGEADASPQDALQAYILHAVDQYGEPVRGLAVNFCTDTSCAMARSDENGVIRFEGAPGIYHVQLLRAPEGYSFDEGFDFYTGGEYGEWRLCLRKD